MTPAEIVAQAARRGVEVKLTPAGDGLRIWSDGDPPPDLVELLKAAKPDIIAALRREPFLEAVEGRPTDVSDARWESAIKGLRAFLLSGYGGRCRAPRLAARRALPCPRAVVADQPLRRRAADWRSRGDRSFGTAIRIRTASGASQAFYRRPEPDLAQVYRERVEASPPRCGRSRGEGQRGRVR